MQRSILVVFVAIATLTAGMIWWYSDAQVVKRQSNTLLESLNITGGETNSFRLLKTNSLTNLLADSVSCRVDMVNYQSEFSRAELEERHLLFVRNVESSSVRADEMSIDMLSKDQAKVSAGLSLAVTGKGGNRIAEQCQLTLLWKKNPDGKWRLTLMEIDRN